MLIIQLLVTYLKQVFKISFLSEYILDKTIPIKLFKINSYQIFRYDQNRFLGSLFLYVNEQVSCWLH